MKHFFTAALASLVVGCCETGFVWNAIRPCSRMVSSSTPFTKHSRATAKSMPYTIRMIQRSGAESFPSPALDMLEEAVDSVLARHPAVIMEMHSAGKNRNMGNAAKSTLLGLESKEREAVAVARRLRLRLDALARNGDCRRCWLQKAHCVCGSIPALSLERASQSLATCHIRNIFVLMHHKEVGLAVDTSKIILAAFPPSLREAETSVGKAWLVVGGIGRRDQPAMDAMLHAMEGNRALVLFPTDDAVTFDRVKNFHDPPATKIVDAHGEASGNRSIDDNDEGWDVIVIDGTWAQAQKLHRSLPNSCRRVQLSSQAVSRLAESIELQHSKDFGQKFIAADSPAGSGRQLRRHPIAWKEVSTLEATRLLMMDMKVDSSAWMPLSAYQQTADEAAKRQLGPPRVSPRF